MIARSERVTNRHKLRLYRTAAIISYKPQPLRTNIEHITHIQQHLAELSTLTTRALIPHIQALHSSHPPPHTSAHQSAPPQVDSEHPQVSCAHKGSKEHHTSLQMQACSQHQSTIFTTTNSSGGSDYGHLLSQLVQCQSPTFSHHKYVFSPHSTHEPRGTSSSSNIITPIIKRNIVKT